MPSFRLDPPKPGLTPKEYREYVKAQVATEIAHLGEDNVLKHEDFVIFYSGPSGQVCKIVIGGGRSNHDRSLSMAIELGASRIDDTQAHLSLGGHNLDDYFTPTLAKLYPDPDDFSKALDSAYAEVWGGLSELFAELDFKTVATAVCGAGQDRVFVKDELPILIKNKHIQKINGIDMQAVRDLYNEVSPDEAFKLICLAELKMTFMKAKKATKSPVDVWNDFYERERFYREERKLPRLVIAPPTVEQEARRKEIIAKYGLKDLYAKAPSDWGGPVVPRPRALVPAKRKYGLH